MIARKSLPTIQPRYGIILAALLFSGAFFCLIFGIASMVKGLEAGILIFSCVFAVLVGWLLGRWKLHPVPGIGLAIAFGIVILFIRLGNLTPRLLVVIWAWVSRLSPSDLIFGEVPLPSGMLNFSLSELVRASEAIISRTSEWLSSLVTQNPFYDPLPTIFVWGLGVWIVSAWAGFALVRNKRAPQAFLPALVLLAGSSGLVNYQTSYLFLFFACVVLFHILYEQIRRESDWDTSHTDFSLEIRTDLTMAAIPLTILILAAAGLIPFISFNWLTDLINPSSQTNVSQPDLAQSFGLNPQGATNTIPAEWRAPGLPTAHLIGSGVELSHKIVMEITVSITNPEGQPFYWRGLTYDWYTGHGWATHSTGRNNFRAGNQVYSYDPQRYRPIREEIHGIESLGGLLYYTGKLLTANHAFRTDRRSTDDMFAATINNNQYAVDSAIEVFTPNQLRQAGRAYPEDIRVLHLQLPEEVPNRVFALARDLTAQESNPYDQVVAIQNRLRQIPYTLDLPAPPKEQDVADYFIFDLKKGYCDYYATAMVVLARAAGIPARLATGFASGHYDPQRNAFIITEADAHSWPEIYFPGYGWVIFEPTAAYTSPLPGEFAEMQPPVMPSQSGIADSTSGQSETPGPLNILEVFLGLLGIFFVLQVVRLFVQAHERSQPAEKRLENIYKSIRKRATAMHIPLTRGDTPFEVSAKLESFISENTSGDHIGHYLAPLSSEISEILKVYTRSAYSPHQVSSLEAQQLIVMWIRASRRLWVVWWLVYLRYRFTRNRILKTASQRVEFN